MPGSKRPPDGHVSMTAIADTLKVDRRVLKALYDNRVITGKRAGGVIWLERQPLAAYLWSRPRCVRDGCGRRVIGDGPGCDRHRRDGRRRADHRCEQCGKPTSGRGRLCRSCATRERNRQGARARLRKLQEGHQDYRVKVERVKAERGLLGVDELLDRLRRDGVPRSAPAIAGYLDLGLLEPVQDAGFAKPLLFTEASADELASTLRGYGDGRLTRFNVLEPAAAPFRAVWYQARHKSAAEFGRLTTMIAAAKGNKVGRPSELDDEVMDRVRIMAARGRSQRAIASAAHISRGQVRRILAK